MPHEDFESNPDYQEHQRQERAPGVYTRSDEPPHELDMLWSSNRHHPKDERSPVIFFGAGFLVSAVVLGAVFFLFFKKPEISTGPNILEQTAEEANLAPKVPASDVSQTPPAASTTTASAEEASSGNIDTYTVRSGDTLERIARRYYGSGTPEYINKIARANNLINPNRLRLGQRLVIPPKNY